MEESPIPTQVQVKVEPEEVVSFSAWEEPEEPVAKRPRTTWKQVRHVTAEEEYCNRIRPWDQPKSDEQLRSEELRARFEAGRVIIENGVTWHRSERRTYDELCHSFFDSRWYRTVYWDKRTEQYESRAPYPKGQTPKPVVWKAPEGWTKETPAEFNRRRSSWKADGRRLEHENVVVGAKHQLYERPDHPLLRVVAVNADPLPPKVLVKDDVTNQAWFIFSDELDVTVHNSKNNIKNWLKRRRAAHKANGTTIWDVVDLQEEPEVETETPEPKVPSFPNYRLAFSA